MTPTARTLDKLRKDGYTAAVVEKWLHIPQRRVDLFGFIDIIAIRDDETLAVQATSYAHVSKRVKKIQDNENLAAVRDAGWRIEVHGWHKKNGRYKCRVVDIS